jgi:hypothetical protein
MLTPPVPYLARGGAALAATDDGSDARRSLSARRNVGVFIISHRAVASRANARSRSAFGTTERRAFVNSTRSSRNAKQIFKFSAGFLRILRTFRRGSRKRRFVNPRTVLAGKSRTRVLSFLSLCHCLLCRRSAKIFFF